MALEKLTFGKTWTNPIHFPTYQESEAQVRADLQYHPDALKDYLNDTLIPLLEDKGVEEITRTDGSTMKYIRRNELGGLETSVDGKSWAPAAGDTIVNDLTTGGTDAALSAEMGKVLAQRPNTNLLDNWYFADPINQRGQAEYGGTAWAYTIDRWQITNAGTKVAESVRYVTLDTGETFPIVYGIAVAATTSEVTPYLRQPLEIVAGQLFGKTITLSMLMTDGTFKTATSTLPAKAPDTGMQYAATADFGHVLYMAETFSVRLTAPKGGGNSFRAVKLELGSQQTLAHQDENGNWVLNNLPPDKGMELLKCQRYYQLFSSADKVPSALTDYRPSMRVRPTVGTIDLNGTTYCYADANL